MTADKLAASLDKARAVVYDADGYVLAWFGGHGIHAYSLDGEEVAYWSAGDFSENSLTPDEAFASMQGHLVDWWETFVS